MYEAVSKAVSGSSVYEAVSKAVSGSSQCMRLCLRL